MFARILLLSFLIALLGTHAVAGIGGDLSSIRKDAKSSGGAYSVIQTQKYSRHEIAHHWRKIHEFANSRGKVFALAWQGRKHPDLKEILGDEHFHQFQSALGRAQRAHRRGGAIIVDEGDFHLEVGGHAMSVYGKAWLKSEIPEGMDLGEIQ